jgi:hypothetical protein
VLTAAGWSGLSGSMTFEPVKQMFARCWAGFVL